MTTKRISPPPSDQKLGRTARKLGAALHERGWTLATAESCTGGWIAKLMTDVPGSSQWFDRSYVTYSNAAKVEMLGVSRQTLSGHGAVSEETVREMAQGAFDRSSAQVTIAISGIAGPDGGTAAKPVGTVWLAWLVHTEALVTRLDRYPGDRDSVRRLAVMNAMDRLLELMVSGE